MKRAMMDAAACRVLLLDNSRFHRRGVHELAPMSAFDVVIVDSGTSAGEIDALRSVGANVYVSGQEPDGPGLLTDMLWSANTTAHQD